MFSSIAQAVIAFCTAFITLASALNKVASTVDNLATVADETSGQYVDDARAQRAKNQKLLEAE